MEKRRKLLFISASPTGCTTLGSDNELHDVDAKIRAALPPDRFDIIVATAARRDELLHLLLAHTPDIVHFSGHGDLKRGILLEDQQGHVAPVGGKALAALFSIVRGKPSIVVLNACSTKRTAQSFKHIVDYTIAMNGPIHDISAIAFGSAFYGALARGLHVPAAFSAAVSQLEVLKLPSKSRPELFIAPGVQFNSSPRTPESDHRPAAEPARAPAPAAPVVNVSGSEVRDIGVIIGNHNRGMKGS